MDAAIRVLGTGGIRALTHRAVDAEAGLPSGSTSNHFRTRDALLRGVVERLADVDRAEWEHMAAQLRPRDIREFVDVIAMLIEAMTGPARAVTIARYALFVEAALHPELQATVARNAQAIASWGAGWLAAVGAPDAARRIGLVIAYLDGVILHQIAYPDPDLDVRETLTALLT